MVWVPTIRIPFDVEARPFRKRLWVGPIFQARGQQRFLVEEMGGVSGVSVLVALLPWRGGHREQLPQGQSCSTDSGVVLQASFSRLPLVL